MARVTAWSTDGRPVAASAPSAAVVTLVASTGTDWKPARRPSRTGVFGGRVRSACQWCFVRGTMQPISETKSSR